MTKNKEIEEQQRKKIGEQLVKYREKKGLTQVSAAAEIQIKNSLLSHYEQGRRKIKPEHLTKLASLYGINEKEFSDTTLTEKKTAYLREILTLYKIKLAVIIGDINKDTIIYADGKLGGDYDSDKDWKLGGGCFYAAKAALRYGFLPVLFSTIGQEDGDAILDELSKKTKEEGKCGVITTWIEKNPTLETSTCTITFGEGNNRKETGHQYNDHCNDFELSRLVEVISSSGAGKNDIIFCHGFRLNRKMREFNASKVIPKEKEDQRREYIQEFMESLSANGDDRPTIVFDLAPATDIYKNMTISELRLVIEKSDVIVAELRTLLGFLFNDKPENISDDVSKAINNDFEKFEKREITIINKKDYDTIIANFLGSRKGNTLILRYGVGNMDYEKIIERNEDGRPEVISDLSDKNNTTGYSDPQKKEKLGSGDMRTFEFLANKKK